MDIEDPMCECGDPSSYHVDGCEQCFIPDCGCREFTDAIDDEEQPGDIVKNLVGMLRE